MPDPVDDPIHRRLADGGPTYVETPTDPANYPDWIVEPWNTGSAALFVVIPLVWIWILRGRYRHHPFLTICLPILLLGGIGGLLYHGLRRYNAFRLMDAVPIYLLGLVVTIWIWIRLGPKLWHVFGMIALVVFLQILWQVIQLPLHWTINLSYASLALLIVVPIVLALIRTRFRYAGWVYTSVICFAIAWVCRISDTIRPPLLPMGTHWLWHLFGAFCTASLSVYVYKLEGISLREPFSGRATGSPGD